MPALQTLAKGTPSKEPPALPASSSAGKPQLRKPGAGAGVAGAGVKAGKKPLAPPVKTQPPESAPVEENQAQKDDPVETSILPPAGVPGMQICTSCVPASTNNTPDAPAAGGQQPGTQAAAMDALMSPLIGSEPGRNAPGAAAQEKSPADSVQTAVYLAISNL